MSHVINAIEAIVMGVVTLYVALRTLTTVYKNLTLVLEWIVAALAFFAIAYIAAVVRERHGGDIGGGGGGDPTTGWFDLTHFKDAVMRDLVWLNVDRALAFLNFIKTFKQQ